MRILVADDHDVVRQGLKNLLTAKPGWQVCAEARNGREAVTLAQQHRPEVVVMDISMPELNGLEAARLIRKQLPKTELAILSLHFSDKLFHDIVDAGARAYILKSDAGKDLVTAVEALSHRGSFFTPRAAEMLRGRFQKKESKAPAEFKSRLTRREREIVQLVAEGKSSKEISTILDISVKTAETHRSNIMRKLELHSVSELVRYAIKNQIIEA